MPQNSTPNSFEYPSANIRQLSRFEQLFRSKLLWSLMVLFFFAVPIIRSVQRDLPEPLPVLSEVPPFQFTDENGKAFGSADLEGKVYIANFIFTSCQTVCPNLLSKVQKVQHRLRGVIDRASIVSFTVDPEFDTPEILFKKARELKANPHVWKFLTASEDEMRNLLIKGFKVPMGQKEGTLYDIAHSQKLVFVDTKGRIRGYYSTSKEDINRLMIDVGLTINNKENDRP